MKPEFLSELRALDVTEGEETRSFELLEDFVVVSNVLGGVVRVPAGFRYDGESIPTALHAIAPPFGQSRRAACVHDYLYKHAGWQRENGAWEAVTRKQADDVYLELALLKGLPTWRALMRFRVLRLVGWAAWRKHRASE